jgi:hypothetical protein
MRVSGRPNVAFHKDYRKHGGGTKRVPKKEKDFSPAKDAPGIFF